MHYDHDLVAGVTDHAARLGPAERELLRQRLESERARFECRFAREKLDLTTHRKRVSERGLVRLFLKLEAANPGGSSKDRPAVRMIQDAAHSGRLRRGSVVVESSSGNMGVGLAQACAWHGLRFICVVDPRAQAGMLASMQALGAEIVMVGVAEGPGGDPLFAHLERVSHLVTTIDGAYWPKQYANALNPEAHAEGDMAEIDVALGSAVEGVFVGVGTTGTLGGCLDFVAANDQATRVTAVDAVGSILFGGKPGEPSTVTPDPIDELV